MDQLMKSPLRNVLTALTEMLVLALGTALLIFAAWTVL